MYDISLIQFQLPTVYQKNKIYLKTSRLRSYGMRSVDKTMHRYNTYALLKHLVLDL